MSRPCSPNQSSDYTQEKTSVQGPEKVEKEIHEKLSKDYNVLFEENKSLKADLESEKNKSEELSKDFYDLYEENQRLEKENKDLKTNLESNNRKQESEKDELKNSFRQTVLELQSSQKLNSQLQSQIQTLTSEREELVNHDNKLWDNYEQLKSEYRQLEVNYNSKQTEYRQLEVNYNSKQTGYHQLEVSYNEIQAESNKYFAKFQRRIEKLEEEKKHLSGEQTKMYKYAKDVEKENENLKEENHSLKEKYENLKKENGTLKGEYENSKTRVSELRQEAIKYQSKIANAIDLTSADNDPSNPYNLKKDIHQLQSLLAKFASTKGRSTTKINQSAADLLFEEYSNLNVKVDKNILGATIQRRVVELILQSLSNGLCQGNTHYKSKISSLTNDDILELEIVSIADKLIELLNRFCETRVDNDDFAKAIPGKVRQQVFSLLAKFAFTKPGNKFVNILADRLVTELDLYREQTSQTREKLLSEAEKLVLFAISVLYFRLKAYGINELMFFESGIEFNGGIMERPDEESKYNRITICSFPLVGLRSTNQQDIILTKAQVMLPDSSSNNSQYQYLETDKGSEITQIKYCPITVGSSSQLLKTCSLCRNSDSDYDFVDPEPANLEDLRQYQEEIQRLKKKITRKQKNLNELNEKVTKNDEVLNSYRDSNEKLKITNDQYLSKIGRAKDIGVRTVEQSLYRFIKPKPDYEKAVKDILAKLGYDQYGKPLEPDSSTHKTGVRRVDLNRGFAHASELGQTPNGRVVYSPRSEN